MSTSRLRQSGLSLIELIVFIVIIGVAVTGVVTTLAYTTGRSADPLQRKQAMLIAESLLEEVSLGHMTFCHPDHPNAETVASAAECGSMPETVGAGGAARPYFNVNDYVAAFNTPTSITPGDTSGKVTDMLGNLKHAGRFTAFVTIKPNAVLGPPGALIVGALATAPNPADTDLLHISVTVNYGSEKITLDRYRTRYAPNSTP